MTDHLIASLDWLHCHFQLKFFKGASKVKYYCLSQFISSYKFFQLGPYSVSLLCYLVNPKPYKRNRGKHIFPRIMWGTIKQRRAFVLHAAYIIVLEKFTILKRILTFVLQPTSVLFIPVFPCQIAKLTLFSACQPLSTFLC
jgi:hypothetical protein